MNPFKRTKSVLLFLLPNLAYAGAGIRIVDQDAAATARGNAFTATADNASAVYYNPAGIARLKGVQFRTGMYAVSLRAKHEAGDGTTTHNRSQTPVLPQFFAAWTPEESAVSFGIGVYAPVGLSLGYDDDTPFRTAGKFGEVRMLTFHPAVAWKLTPELALGAGLTVNEVEAELSRGIFAKGDEFKVVGAGVSYGFNAGVLWQPAERHSFGVRYHSATRAELSGRTSVKTQPITVPTPLGPFRVPGASSEQNAKTAFQFPQFVALGYSFRPAPGWNIELGAEWTDWNSLDELTVHRKRADTVNIPFHWRSNWLYQAGITRTWESGWHASVGYIFAENVVPDATLTPLIPDYDRHVFSGGFGYRAERWKFDLAYQYSRQPTRRIEQGTSSDGTYGLETNALSLSCGVGF